MTSASLIRRTLHAIQGLEGLCLHRNPPNHEQASAKTPHAGMHVGNNVRASSTLGPPRDE